MTYMVSKLPIWFSEPEYDFDKKLQDTDAYEKEKAEFVCEVNDEGAKVQWFKEDKVCQICAADYINVYLVPIMSKYLIKLSHYKKKIFRNRTQIM